MPALIQKFLLPSSFPDFMVPDEAGKLTKELTGKPLFEAKRIAERLGFQPLVKPFPRLGLGHFHFSLSADGMLIPFAVQIGDVGAHENDPQAPVQEDVFFHQCDRTH